MKTYLLPLLALPLCAQQLTLVSGNGQMMFEQFPSTSPMVVRAVDAAGRPLSNIAINWSTTQGQGSIRADAMTQTDSDGFARAFFIASSIQPGTSWAQAIVTASSQFGSVPFYMTTVQSGAGLGQPVVQFLPPLRIVGPRGSTVPDPFIVQVVASAGIRLGQGIPNVGVRLAIPFEADPSTTPAAICAGPAGIVLTDSRGVAECQMILNNNVGMGTIFALAGEMMSSRQVGIEITAGQACNVTLSPASQNFGSAGGPSSISVTAVNCPWNVSTSATWITINSPSSGSGTGSGQVAFTVAPNSGPARTGTIVIGNAIFNVSQGGAGTTLPLAFAVGAALPQATAGLNYSTTLTASGGQPPYTWTLTSGAPPGLGLNNATGVLAGTPSTAGSYSLTVRLNDAAGGSVSQTFTLQVSASQSPGGGLTFVTPSLPAAQINAPYSQQITVTGGCQNPFSGGARVEIVSGSLPPGLQSQSAFAGNGIVISGTPTLGGTFNFGVRASDSCGAFAVRDYAIQVSVSTVAPTMTVSSVGLAFTWQRGSGTAPSDQNLTISTGGASIPFTISATSNGNWLAVTPVSGTTEATVAVRIVNADLPVGTYQGSLAITSTAPNSPVTVPVTLNVTAPPNAVVSPTSLTFQYVPGSTFIPTQVLNVAAGSPGVGVPFNVAVATATGGSWLSVESTFGTTPGTIGVSVNPLSLSPGQYSGAVTIQPAFNVSPTTVPVTLIVAGSGPQFTSIVNGASFVPENGVAPGQIITIFGSGIGPAALTTAQLTPARTVATQLEDVRVWFDDQPAPLLYVSSTQVAAVVPYAVAGRSVTRVSVEYRGIRSTIRDLPVVAAAPAIFTIGGGTQGAILNQDASVNGSQNGAQAGSIISIFATGEGQTIPGGLDGVLVPATALARPVLPVSVTIAGREAQVLYAGSAPEQVAGLIQVNVRVPQDIPSGAQSVTLRVGNEVSQPGVTVFIRP